jgi:hypothetical protein
MASLVFDNFFDKWARAQIDFDADTFKWLLTTSSYVEDKATHQWRADVTNEVANGNGYATGGNTCTVTITLDTVNHRLDLVFNQVTWPTSTITARKAVAYKSTGNASTDPIILVNHFASDVSTTNGTFTLNSSTLRIQN